MNDPQVRMEQAGLNDLLKDSGILKIVTAVNLASISILELLEYDVTRDDINRAFAKQVIAFDRAYSNSAAEPASGFERGDQYFRFLSSKVKLTELGIFILETIENYQGTQAGRVSRPDMADTHLHLPDTYPGLLGGAGIATVKAQVTFACRGGP